MIFFALSFLCFRIEFSACGGIFVDSGDIIFMSKDRVIE